MQKFVKIACLLAFCLCFAIPASAQWTLFVVEDGGVYPHYSSLAGALATAATYPDGPHKIMVMAGTYAEQNLTAVNVDEIYGDPSAGAEEIIFTAPSGGNFLQVSVTGTTVQHMTLQGYSTGFYGTGTDFTVQDMSITGASGTGVNVSGWTTGTISGVAFSNLSFGVYGGTATSFLTVQNCTFDNAGNAIDLSVSTDGTFDLLGITNSNYGLVLRATSWPNVVTGCTITGMVNDGVWLNDANVTMSGCLVHGNGGYAINKSGVAGYTLTTVQDNCFFDNAAGTAECSNTQAGITVSHNYYGDDNYTWDGAAGTVDGNPWLNENNPMGPATAEIDTEFDVDIQWTVPACGELDGVMLAAYEFTVNYPAGLMSLVSSEYDEGYLGTTGDGALYTGIDDATPGQVTFAAANFTAPGVGTGFLAHLTFLGNETGAGQITISSKYRDENDNPLSVNSTPLDVAVEDNTAPTITVEANDPLNDDTYSEGGPGAGPHVKLYVQGAVHDNHALKDVRYRFDGAGSWLAVKTVAGEDDTYGALPTDFYIPITSLSAAAHTLNLRVRDQSNNPGFVDYPFSIDRTGPVLTSITLRDEDGCAVDPDFTNDPAIKVDLVDDGDGETMEFYDSDVPGWQTAVAWANPADYTLLDLTENGNLIYVRLFDKYNNMGNQVSDAITLDMTAPNPGGPLTLAGGAAKTSNPTVSFSLSSWGGGIEYNISESESDFVCGNGGWKPTTPGPYQITLSDPDESKTVYLAVRDEAGNIGTSINDVIELDREGPDFVSFTVVDQTGDDCSDSWMVDVVIGWSDADVDEVQLGSATGVYDMTVNLSAETSPKTIAYTLPGGLPNCDIDNWVFGILVDDIGNPGAEASDKILVDCYAPSITSIELSDGGNTVWSQSATVDVTLTGWAADIVELRMGEANGGPYPTVIPFDAGGSGVVQFTFAAPTATDYLYLIGADCAGRVSGQVSDGMKFDLIDPVLSGLLIEGGAAKTANNPVSVDWTTVEANPLTIWMAETSDFTGPTAVSMAWSGGPPKPFTLSGEGSKTIYVKLVDKSGRESNVLSGTIELDQTPPGGTMVVQQNPVANPFAQAGYTTSLTVEAVGISADGDAVWMQIWTPGGSNTGQIALAPSHSPITLAAPEGTKTVNIRFKDGGVGAAWGAVTAVTIIYDITPPAPPPVAIGGPGGSVDFSWDAAPQAHSYIMRYNVTGEYPGYEHGPPPWPMTLIEGFEMEAQFVGTEYSFEGPDMDMYAISIWSRDSAGNVSASPNATLLSTNYILGDFKVSEEKTLGHDGCLDFVDEFGDLALAYNSVPSDPNFNPLLDIAPAQISDCEYYPIPDDAVEFEDLVRFAINYDAYRCGATMQILDGPGRGKIAVGGVDIAVVAPSWFDANEEYTVSVQVDNAAAIKGFHFVFDYNNDDVELISVSMGEGFSAVERSFFYYDPESMQIDVSGVVFGADAAFADGELFSITLKARSSGSLRIDNAALIVRDSENNDVETNFTVEQLASAAPLPTEFGLAQNYPNPFNAGTVIPISLKDASEWTLTIYNVAGQVVRTFRGTDEAGVVNVRWNGTAADGSQIASGMYFYRAVAGDSVATKKMVLLK